MSDVISIKGITEDDDETVDWLALCHVTDRGLVLTTLHNVMLAMRYDLAIRDCVAYDQMFCGPQLMRPIPSAKYEPGPLPRPVTAAGDRGPTGIAGPPGKDATTIACWTLDRAANTVTPVMSDGTSGPPLNLRGLFEQFQDEVG